jgi:hypothetical protein
MAFSKLIQTDFEGGFEKWENTLIIATVKIVR